MSLRMPAAGFESAAPGSDDGFHCPSNWRTGCAAMFNDTSTPLALLASRRSGKPRDLIAPGPDREVLAAILTIAARTPDHGKLFPWRFIVIPPDARDAFEALLVSAWQVDHPAEVAQAADAGSGRAAIREFAHQAPTLVVVVSTPHRASPIPLWEQQLSAGAACMNLLHAAHAHGFAAGWLTGWAATSERVRGAFGSTDDAIAGFVFIGTPARALQERPRPTVDQVVRVWHG